MFGELDFGLHQLNVLGEVSRYCNWDMGWTKEKLEFDYRQEKEILSSLQRSEQL
jgi:hypothetical protein